MKILAILTLAAGARGAGAGGRPPVTAEIFDEQSASTLLVASAPTVFARARSDVAAFAHDYATLVAVQIDRSGQPTNYLLLYRWSTVDPRMSAPPPAQAGELRLLADGRRIELQPLPSLPISLARRRALHVPNHGEVVAHAYPVDASLLRFIANSRAISLRMPQEPLDTPFSLWQDGRPALTQFLGKAEGP